MWQGSCPIIRKTLSTEITRVRPRNKAPLLARLLWWRLQNPASPVNLGQTLEAGVSILTMTTCSWQASIPQAQSVMPAAATSMGVTAGMMPIMWGTIFPTILVQHSRWRLSLRLWNNLWRVLRLLPGRMLRSHPCLLLQDTQCSLLGFSHQLLARQEATVWARYGDELDTWLSCAC